MENFIAAAILIAILGSIVYYLHRQKKKGVKCVGCPYAGQCGSQNCQNHQAQHE